MSIPAISFVIPVRDDASSLRRCLQSIAGAGAAIQGEIVVADNGSRDDSVAVATAAGARVLSVPGRPVAEVRNRAARAARAPLIAFIDADHEISADWTARAIQLLDDPAVAAAGAEYVPPPGASWVQRVYDRFRDHQPGVRRVDWLPSGNLVVRRSVFDAVGGFDESLESCEDVDFCRKVRETGGQLLAFDGLRSVHFGDPRTLAALFFAELWRGRDNLRVSLRERLTLRSAPSVVMPLVNLAALAVIVGGAIGWKGGGLRYAAVALAILLVSVGARALRLLARVPAEESRMSAVAPSVLVAATYELARALALVWRATHAVRRRGSEAP